MTLERLLPLFGRAQLAQVRRRHAHLGFKSSKSLLDALITLHDFELISVIKFQRCLQGKEMFRAVIAFQGLGNLLCAALDLRMPHLGQLDAIAFASNDSAQNAHSSHPGYIADDSVDLDIHFGQRFLHALHQTAAILAQGVSQAQ